MKQCGGHLTAQTGGGSLEVAQVAGKATLQSGGGSIVTLTYIGSERVFPNYNVMGVAKAALEAQIR